MTYPYVIISAAMSLDGCIDDAAANRLILSNDADLDQVDALRAECDAILVGAGTVRADNPRLLVRSVERQQQRLANAQSAHPRKVTLTATGNLDRASHFFQAGDCDKLVYCPLGLRDRLGSELGSLAATIAVNDGPVQPDLLLRDLHARGVRRLLVEGGSATNTLFLSAGLVDELRLAVAPRFIGEANAPRFVQAAVFPHDLRKPAHLKAVEALGDMAILHYQLEHRP
jgi:5-amino-6-(5-phosphoribosylamino)uracil reductase